MHKESEIIEITTNYPMDWVFFSSPYLPLYNDVQQRRHEMKPGVTGWAQVYGCNAIIWQQKFEYDVWYVDN